MTTSLLCEQGGVLWEEGPVAQHSASSCAAQRQMLQGCGAHSASARVLRVSYGSPPKLLLTTLVIGLGRRY